MEFAWATCPDKSVAAPNIRPFGLERFQEKQRAGLSRLSFRRTVRARRKRAEAPLPSHAVFRFGGLLLLLFRDLGHGCLGQQQNARHRNRVLKRNPDDFRRIYDPRRD